jgi:hypothetical protein
MSEAKDKKTDDKEEKKGKKTLSLGGTLSLKGGASSGPKPSAPGTVAVEVRRKRAPTPTAAPKQGAVKKDDGLTSAEREARKKALQNALSDDNKGKTSLPERKRVTIEDKKKEQAAAKDEEQSAREKELEELRKIEEEERRPMPLLSFLTRMLLPAVNSGKMRNLKVTATN